MIGSLLINDHLAVMNDDGRWDCEYIPARIILRAQFAIPAEHSEADGQYGHKQISAAANFFGVEPQFVVLAGSKAWDESQHPRDEGGRFATSDSNDGPDGGRDDSGDATAHPISPAIAKIERLYPPANKQATETDKRFVDSSGKLTPERAKLHSAIADKIRGSVPAASGEKTYTLMGGGPASGKSSIIKAGLVELPAEHVHIDSDAIKAELPEYQALVKGGDVRAAGYVHEESSSLAKRVQKESFAAGQHVVLDGTGNASIKGVQAKVDAARAAGYKVKGEYVTCSTNEAVRRNVERAKKTGRLPPEKILRETHASVSRILPEAVSKGLFDSVRLWDSEVLTDGKPTLVMSAEGSNVTIHNETLWEAFKAKGSETAG